MFTQMRDGRREYLIQVHTDEFPQRGAPDNAGSGQPLLVLSGSFLERNYLAHESTSGRTVARMERLEGKEHGGQACLVQVAAQVDLGLLVLASVVVEASEQAASVVVESSEQAAPEMRHS